MKRLCAFAALMLVAFPLAAQTPADARDEAIRSRGFIRAAETQLTKVIAALDSIRSDTRVDTVTVTDTVIRTVVQVDSVPVEVVRWDTVTLVRVDTVFVAGPPEPAPEPGTLDVGVGGGSEAVLAICDGSACDLTWNHYEQTDEGFAPPAYAVWLVDGDPLSVELPVWPDGSAPVTIGGVTARPVTEGPCAYPVVPRGPAPQLHACRVGGVPDTPGLSWAVTWARVDVAPVAEEAQAVGLSPVSDLRVTMTGPTAVALEWTQVSDGRGGAADYGVRWLQDGEWSPVVAVIGWAAGQPIGYTVPGLQPGTSVTVQVAPFRGVLPDRAVVGLPADVTATTP